MKQKGFTLIELLAVIVILAIIAVITVPMIMNVIDKAKLGALEDSAYGLIESANLYYSENVQNLTNITTFDFVDGKQTSDSKLTYKGSIDSGKLILTIEGKVVVCIDDGTNYAYKDLNETKVKSGKGTCSYNGETGSFDIISDVGALNQELSDLKKIGNALSSEILEGKTALVGGIEVTGTMKNKSGLSVTTSGITTDDNNTYFAVPESGYYDTNSKLQVLTSSLGMNLKMTNYSTANINYTCPKDTVAVFVMVNDLTYKLYKNGSLVSTSLNANGMSGDPMTWYTTAKEGDVLTGNTSSYYNFTVVQKQS